MAAKPKKTIPQAQREKIRKALKGRKRPIAVREKISKTMKGREFTDEHRKNISKGKKGKTRHSRDARQRMSKSHTGLKATPKAKEAMRQSWLKRKGIKGDIDVKKDENPVE